MTFLDNLKSSLGYGIGIYNLYGEFIEGLDLGFSSTSDSLVINGKTYIACENHIIAVESQLSEDACRLIRSTYRLFYGNRITKEDSLEYIIKNNVPNESIQGKYIGFNVIYITSMDNIWDIVKSIYEDESVEFVVDRDGIYLIKLFEDVSQEAEAIIEGIWQEKGIKAIIGCGRTVSCEYTIKDAAIHAKNSSKIAKRLDLNSGFFHIDKILVYGLINSIGDNDIAYYLHGHHEGFMLASRDKELLDTAEQLFKCNLNISEAARNLYIHRNTLLYRIEKIKNLTGLDIKGFEDALTFKFIITVLKLKNTVT